MTSVDHVPLGKKKRRTRPPDTSFFLTIKSDRSLILGNDSVARDALVGLLNTASGGDKDRTIFRRADKRLPYGEVMSVMALLRTAGYVKIALVGE